MVLSKDTGAQVSSVNVANNYGVLMMERLADAYMTVSKPDKSAMGFFKFQDISSSSSVDWYARISCDSTFSLCDATALAES